MSIRMRKQGGLLDVLPFFVLTQEALMKSLAEVRIVHNTTPVPTLAELAKPGQAYTTDTGPPLTDAVERGEHDVVGDAPRDSVEDMELDDGGEDVPLTG